MAREKVVIASGGLFTTRSLFLWETGRRTPAPAQAHAWAATISKLEQEAEQAHSA